MKRKFMIALITMMCMCGCMTGCASKENSDVADTKKEVSVAGAEQTGEDVSENAEEEIKVEGSSAQSEAESRIIAEDLTSGYIKIGDDLFRAGGYYTVIQFVDEYSDRYYISEAEELDKEPGDYFEITIITLSEPRVEIPVSCVSVYNNAKTLGDCIVASIGGKKIDSSLKEKTTFPTGLKPVCQGMKEEDILPILKEYGLAEGAVTSDYFVYDAYEYKEPTENIGPCYYFHIRGKEPNLLGEYPVFGYYFMVGKETNEVEFHTWGVDSNAKEEQWKDGKAAQ